MQLQIYTWEYVLDMRRRDRSFLTRRDRRERGILALGVYISNELALKTTARSYTRPTNSYVGAIILVLIAEPDRVARCRGGKIKVSYYSYVEKAGFFWLLFKDVKSPWPPSVEVRQLRCWAPLGPIKSLIWLQRSEDKLLKLSGG